MSARDPDKLYLVRGSTLDRIEAALDDLWSGNNIQRGPGIRIRKGGKNAGLVIAASAVPSSPANAAGLILPAYWGSDASSGSTPAVSVKFGTHNGVVPTISGTALSTNTAANIGTLGSSDQIVYIEVDFNTSGTVVSASIHSSATSSPPASVVNINGSATGYQTLFAVSITVTGGKASVACTQNVSGSQACTICGSQVLFGLV